MATATFPPDVSVSNPSSKSDDLALIPAGDVLYEVVDGKVVEIPPMGAYECDIANFLAELLNEHASRGRLGRAFVELLFRIDVAGDLKRRPDLAFVSAVRWPFRKRIPRGEAWEMNPNLAVEVVSKSNTAEEIVTKVGDYFRTGTELVWVVYPSSRQLYVYTSPTDVRILVEPANLDGGDVLPGFQIPLYRLFEDEPDLVSPEIDDRFDHESQGL
jgi:Uma2 family endonuclease